MRIQKRQAAVMTALNLLIAALATVILLGGTVSAGAATSASAPVPGIEQPQPEEHNKFRAASRGRVSEVECETRLMGTGDESVIAVFSVEGCTYIFGNATVGDLDFDSHGGFLCVADGDGRLTAFTYFAGNITAVGAIGSGFAVGVTDGSSGKLKSTMYFVGYDGASRDVSPLDGSAVGIYVKDDGRVAVVTQPNSNSLKLTEYTPTDGDFEDGKNTRISGGFELEFFDCYMFGNKYVICVRASSLPRYDSLTFYALEAGGDATSYPYGGSAESMLCPYAVLPRPSGYLAIGRRNGSAVIVSVDYSFKRITRDTLDFDFDDASLTYADGKYYACFRTSGGVTTMEIDSLMNRHEVTEASGVFVQYAVCGASGGNVTLIGECDGKLSIVTPSTKRKLELSVKSPVVYAATKNADGGIALVLSATGGDALSVPSGGRDVYVARIKN